MINTELKNIPIGQIGEYTSVKLKLCGNHAEILYSQHQNQFCAIEKIDSQFYMNLITGEISEYKKSDNKSQNLRSVARSLSLGRDLINTNVTDVKNCRWLTLTYAENMTDTTQLLQDFRHFNERLRAKYGRYEYITAVEPQGRGAWHMHVILIFPSIAPFIPNSDVANAWKRGFVKINALDNVDNVGAYLTAYLGDMELSTSIPVQELEQIDRINVIKDVELTDENGIKQNKRFIKGARLALYPSGMHIFRHSKNIKQPIIERLLYYQAKEKIGADTPIFSKAIQITADEYVNILQYEYYNCNTDLRKNQEFDEKNNIT